ncbi:MAG: pentapeptide repeat-containing protein [Actinomycetota bacterium]|nr:pentapeptide repeat-containing protein [Actinomycetota bacterium]
MTHRAARTLKLEPDAPLGPAEFDPAPPEVEQDALWDCVAANDSVIVPSHVADWKIQESQIVGVDLAARGFTGFRCRDTHFVHCDLSGASFDGATLDRVVFSECRLTGTVFSGTQLGDVRIDDCRADLLNLRMAHARNVLMESSVLRAADLTSCQFVNSAFLRCDLREAILDNSDLAGTRLHGSELDGVRSPLALRSCLISGEQQVTVGALLLAALDIAVTDDMSGR